MQFNNYTQKKKKSKSKIFHTQCQREVVSTTNYSAAIAVSFSFSLLLLLLLLIQRSFILKQVVITYTSRHIDTNTEPSHEVKEEFPFWK